MMVRQAPLAQSPGGHAPVGASFQVPVWSQLCGVSVAQRFASGTHSPPQLWPTQALGQVVIASQCPALPDSPCLLLAQRVAVPLHSGTDVPPVALPPDPTPPEPV